MSENHPPSLQPCVRQPFEFQGRTGRAENGGTVKVFEQERCGNNVLFSQGASREESGKPGRPSRLQLKRNKCRKIIRRPCSHVSDNHLNSRAGQAGRKMGERSKFSNRSSAGITFFSRKEQAGRKAENPAVHLVYSEKGTNVGKSSAVLAAVCQTTI